MEPVEFIVYIGDDVDLLVAVDAWKAAHPGEIEHVDGSDGGTALLRAAQSRSLFTAPRRIVAHRVDTASLELLGRVADLCGDDLAVCATARKLKRGTPPFPTQRLDRAWRTAQARQMYTDAGVSVTQHVRQMIASLTDGDLTRLRNILAVADLAGLDSLNERQARLLAGTSAPAAAGWDIADALFSGDGVAAVAAARRADPIPALAYLTGHVTALVVASETGEDSRRLAERLNLAPWAAERIVKRAASVPTEVLYRLLDVLCDGDVGARGGGVTLPETVARAFVVLQPVEM